ncbi:hypothetical protein [Streptomyces sp. NPDC056600]|uniref:hypothetical protein n=1 Tax=Streptomyces sp. NPDC056600 TaxID=3345874 RepID=UPI0036B6B7AD
MLIGLLKAANHAPGQGSDGKAGPAKVLRDLDEQGTDRSRRNQDKMAAEKRQQAVTECTRRTRDTWKPFVEDVREAIVAETRDQVDLDASLRRLVEQLQQAVAEGGALLRAGTEPLRSEPLLRTEG